MKRICVIGSLNMDLVAAVNRFPVPGETITGSHFGTYPGGKGANQAVAAGKLGADTLMVGKLGNDLYGQMYVKVLKENHVQCDGITMEEGISSGIAVIEVNSMGENHIVIIPGANRLTDIEHIDSKWEYIEKRDIFLFQLEIPVETTHYAIKRLKAIGKTVVLDPAPAKPLPDSLFECIDYITPNETEIEILTGIKVQNDEMLRRAAKILLDKGVGMVIAKAGKRGAYIIGREEFIHVPGFKVNAIDTTAAGDSFNAGFAYALSRGNSLIDCVRVANAVGAISTTAMGAQAAMPTEEQLIKFMGA